MPAKSEFYEILKQYAESLRDAYPATGVGGDPEDQLKPVIKGLLEGFSGVSVQTEVRISEGRPDLGVYRGRALVGFVELKEPGKSIAPSSFRGHDRKQWKRFRELPNLVYTNGRDWVLYRDGSAVRRASLGADPLEVGAEAVSPASAQELEALLTDFLNWAPIVPHKPKELAQLLAKLARFVRQRAKEAMAESESGVGELWVTWKTTLFPTVDEDGFADAYAQTLTFALLLARVAGAHELHDPRVAADALRDKHGLLGAVLDVLAHPGSRAFDEIRVEYELLARVLEALDPSGLRRDKATERDPWLYFYEDFLAEYDPKMRKDYGVYFTPVPVVSAMTHLTHDVLRRMGKRAGLADENVLILDPAVGTGTFQLAVFDLALLEAAKMHGEGIVPSKAEELAGRLYAFEILIGPYAVAHLRLQQAYFGHGADTRPKVYLTDTLEAPELRPLGHLGLLERPLVKEHEEALNVKRDAPVLVAIGNPPYDRHSAKERKGGWVRFGFGQSTDRERERVRRGAFGVYAERRPLDDFTDPVREMGAGIHLKNTYNLYVYFWRWALWKVFQSPGAPGPGVVAFITGSSYLRGPGFAGMRKFMREVFDDLWIIDLGGDNRAPTWARADENVFNIETPVAIAVGVRYGREKTRELAEVHYTRFRGSREEKFESLSAVTALGDLEWERAPVEPMAPFVPGVEGAYSEYPALSDLFPWQHSGVECKRTWPIAPDPEVLRARWRKLTEAEPEARAKLLVESRGLLASSDREDILAGRTLRPIRALSVGEEPIRIIPYGYRTLDRQWAILDPRVCQHMRPSLIQSHGPKQLYLTTLMSSAHLGLGPGAMATHLIPDRHHFRGSYGGKDTIPLYRDPEGLEPNLAPGLLVKLGEVYGYEVTPEDLVAYVYGVLSNPTYTATFMEELEAEHRPRVPITKDPELFGTVAEVGRELLWLHTYGHRYAEGRSWPPPGTVKVEVPIPHSEEGYPEGFGYDASSKTLKVGGGRIAPVSQAAWEYEISKYNPLRSWLKYRMKKPAGRATSPLNDILPNRWSARFTEELLELIRVLERTVELNRQQGPLLERVLASPLFTEAELRLDEIPEELRRPPNRSPDGMRVRLY